MYPGGNGRDLAGIIAVVSGPGQNASAWRLAPLPLTRTSEKPASRSLDSIVSLLTIRSKKPSKISAR
jgi:hypothetical protein